MPSVGRGSIAGDAVAVEGVALAELRDRLEPLLGDEAQALLHVQVGIVAEHDRNPAATELPSSASST